VSIEQRHLGIGKINSQIIEAQRSNRLRLLDDNDIKGVLRYAMILVGLRGNNLPSNEEKFVLLNFIKSNFGNQTLEEIKLAFDLAVSGTINIDAKCYENFSCEYFSRIVNAYIEYARQETKNIPKQIEEIKPIPSDAELKKMAIDNANFHRQMVFDYDNGKSQFNWKTLGGLSSLYLDLKKFEIFELNNDEQIRIMTKFKHLKGEEFNIECRSEAYKYFIQTLVDFDCYLNEEGEVKPLSE